MNACQLLGDQSTIEQAQNGIRLLGLVFIVGDHHYKSFLKQDFGAFTGSVRRYRCFEHLVITPDAWEIEGDSVRLEATLYNPYPFPVDFATDRIRVMAYYYRHGRKWWPEAFPATYLPLTTLAPGASVERTFTFALISRPAEGFGLSLKRAGWPATTVMKRVPLEE